MTEQTVLYSDGLIELTRSEILFRHYYYPTGDRRLALSEVDRIEALRPTLWNGRWRLHGTGNLRTWFPRDLERPWRDTLFLVHLHGAWRRIGFTVEDSTRVSALLREAGLLAP